MKRTIPNMYVSANWILEVVTHEHQDMTEVKLVQSNYNRCISGGFLKSIFDSAVFHFDRGICKR
jgi:hypothetical protein